MAERSRRRSKGQSRQRATAVVRILRDPRAAWPRDSSSLVQGCMSRWGLCECSSRVTVNATSRALAACPACPLSRLQPSSVQLLPPSQRTPFLSLLKGVFSPRDPNFNYTGKKTTACTLFPPSADQSANHFTSNGTRAWWNATDFPELTSCQPPINDEDAVSIDEEARHRCQTLLSVDDTYAQILSAVEQLGQLAKTYVIISSDHGESC
jgi:hypothetical protein